MEESVLLGTKPLVDSEWRIFRMSPSFNDVTIPAFFFPVEKLNILSKSRYNVDLILVMYYISAGQTSLLQVQ